MGRIEEAKAVYRKAININPNNYIVYNNLAFLFYKEKRFIEARENYIKSLNINSNYTKALNNFATVLMELGITEKTYIGNKISSQLNLCEEAISNLKITKSQISNIEKVLESFTKSLRLDPHQNEIWDIIHFPFYIIKYIKKMKITFY